MSTGGARYGAGRPAHKSKSGNLCRLDIRAIARKGYLEHNVSFSWEWQRGGKPAGSIAVSIEAHSSITLHYTTTANDERRSVVQPVTLAYSPCHFGKPRPWLRCPHCKKRVAILYLRWGVFRCRTCQRTAYASQSEIVIRGNKAVLVDWLQAANEPAPEPPTDPNDWRELAAAYLAHHFKCPAWIAAGRGSQYGQRCGAGMALWRLYCD